jgi:hypothetical protein
MISKEIPLNMAIFWGNFPKNSLDQVAQDFSFIEKW